MKPRDSFHLLKLGLAAYRLANMASKEFGPLDVFFRFRTWVDIQDANSKHYEKTPSHLLVTPSGSTKYWKSLRDLLRCPYCLGVWFAFILLFAPGWIVDWLAVAGVQHVVQKAGEK